MDRYRKPYLRKPVTVSLGPEEEEITERVMATQRCSRSAAIRYLIRTADELRPAPSSPKENPSS